jgi:hypothetical protein
MQHTRFKTDDITFQLILAHLSQHHGRPSWTIFFAPMSLIKDPASALSIVQFMRKLKDAYYCRTGRKDDEALLGAQQTHLAVTRRRSLVNKIAGTIISSAYCRFCKRRNHTRRVPPPWQTAVRKLREIRTHHRRLLEGRQTEETTQRQQQ